MKRKKHEIIFYNKNKLSIKTEDHYQIYEKEALMPFYQQMEQEIKKKDGIRRLCTKLIFGILCVGAILYGIFGRPNGNFWFFIFLIVFVLSWALLYLVFGLIFYPCIHIDWHFKDMKSPLDEKCVTYYSSHYRPYIDKYEKYLGKVDFTYTPNASKKKRKMVGFALVMPKRRGIIFNGKISSNIPYFAFYFNHGKKLFFMPGFIVYLYGKKTKLIPYEQFHVQIEDNDSLNYAYKKIALYHQEECLEILYVSNNFNQNFFNIKF